MNPPLFFDHFKFEYAKKSTVDSFCPTLSKHVNAPVMRSLTQKKIKDLKVFSYHYLIHMSDKTIFNICCTIGMEGNSIC